MEARDVEPAVMRLADVSDDLVQGQLRGVDQPGGGWCGSEDRVAVRVRITV